MATESTPKAQEPTGREGDPSPEEIQAEIEATREELGDTFAEIAEKADVKKQAKRKAAEAKAKATAKKDELKGKAAAQKDEIKAKATPDAAQQVASQAGDVARENPVPTAAIGAFAGGVIIGWILGRR